MICLWSAPLIQGFLMLHHVCKFYMITMHVMNKHADIIQAFTLIIFFLNIQIVFLFKSFIISSSSEEALLEI